MVALARAALLLLLLLTLQLVLSAAAPIIIHAAVSPGGLLRAQAEARTIIARRPALDVHVVLDPGTHRLASPLVLGQQDSGEAGRFRVMWSSPSPNTTVFDGGVDVMGPWQAQSGPSFSGGLWSAPLPPSLREQHVRQLYVDGTRMSRTRVDAADLGFRRGPPTLSDTELVVDGFLSPSVAPLHWHDPSSVELVADFSWVQHRCPVSSVAPAPVPPPSAPPAPRPSHPSACHWSADWKVVRGWAGDNILATIPMPGDNATFQACQRTCCSALPKCKAVFYGAWPRKCCLLTAPYERYSSPTFSQKGFLADLNCSGTSPAPTCPPEPPSPQMRSHIQMAQQCLNASLATSPDSLTTIDVAWFENVGLPTAAGEFYVDIKGGRVYVATTSRSAPPMNVSVGLAQSLLEVTDAHDISFHNLSFRRSGWDLPSRKGLINQYGNVISDFDGHEWKGQYTFMTAPAAVTVNNGQDLHFQQCDFRSLGSWGMELKNVTQRSSITRSSFDDLSGGGISVGDIYCNRWPSDPKVKYEPHVHYDPKTTFCPPIDHPVTHPTRQMKGIVITDNILTRIGREYPQSPAIHTFCVWNSTVSHNRVSEVGYTGISFNWPTPEQDGYSRDNTVDGNDVSRYMSYFSDGGGIHTIGRSPSTSISRNYFHDAASGEQCGSEPCHSVSALAAIYIDNESGGFSIDENVVVDTPHMYEGWLFFQPGPWAAPSYAGPMGGAAINNTARQNTICNSGAIPPSRNPFERIPGPNVTGTINVSDCAADLPAAARGVVGSAGPRS